MDYNIVFAGKILPGFTQDQVKANIARLFRITDMPTLERLFSGKPAKLKSGIDADKARRYVQALREAGAECEMEPVAPKPRVSFGEVDTAAFAADPFASFGDEAMGGASPAQPAAAKAPTPVMDLPRPSAAPAAPTAPPPQPPAARSPLDSLALIPIEIPEEAEPAASASGTAGVYQRPPAPPPPPPPGAGASASPRNTGTSRVRQAAGETNSSGSGEGTYVPDEVSGLCWGGFFVPFFWGIRHSAILLAILSFVPLVNIGVMFYLLFKGREIAWQRVSWPSTEQFNKEQRVWSIVGLIVFAYISYRIYSATQAVHEMQKGFYSDNAADRNAAEQKVLDQIQDPKQREQMQRIYQQMEIMRQQQQQRLHPQQTQQ